MNLRSDPIDPTVKRLTAGAVLTALTLLASAGGCAHAPQASEKSTVEAPEPASPPAPMRLRIDKVSVPVSDQDRAIAFYRDVLGFELVADRPFGPGQRWVELRLPGQDLALVLYTAEEHRPRIGSFQHVLFTSDDVEALYEELTAKGVEFPSPPQRRPWGVSAVFADPDGNTFALNSAAR